MTPSDWVRIATDIVANHDRFDGFVVLHGTDTMAYTASALSFMLRGLTKPVIVTGSQVPLCEVQTDARHNLITSLLIAGHERIPEVCLYFHGRLLRGNRAVKVNSSGFDAFDSPNFPDLGRTGIRFEVRSELLRAPEPIPVRLDEVGSAMVGALRLFPGIQAELVAKMLEPPLQGLVLECYGVGNGPVRDRAFLDALAAATDRGVVIVDVTQCLRGTVDLRGYKNGSALADVGVISGFDMTAEAALTKLFYLFERKVSSARVRQLVAENLRGELTPSPRRST